MTLTADQARHRHLTQRVRHLPGPGRAEVVLLDPDTYPAAGLRAQLRDYGITATAFDEPVRAVAAAALGQATLFIVSCHVNPHDLLSTTEAVRQQLGIQVVLACDRWDADLIGPAVLAGANPGLGLPYTCEDVIHAIGRLGNDPLPTAHPLLVGELSMSLQAHEVAVSGHPVALSPTEFEVLGLLMAKADSAVGRPQLAARLWPDKAPPAGGLTALTKRLRRKLAEAGLPNALHTVRGFGYRLDSAGCVRRDAINPATRASTSSTMVDTSLAVRPTGSSIRQSR